MVFDKFNAHLINSKEISLHDDILTEIRFDRAAYTAVLLFFSQEKGQYYVSFFGVIGFEMTSCDYWGASPHILDFELVESNECILISKLSAKGEEYAITRREPIDNSNYIETVLTFSSGDCFRIACKEIQIDSRTWPERNKSR